MTAFDRKPACGQTPDTVWPLRKGLRISFQVDGAGKAARLATPLADGPTYRLPAGDIVFTAAGR